MAALAASYWHGACNSVLAPAFLFFAARSIFASGQLHRPDIAGRRVGGRRQRGGKLSPWCSASSGAPECGVFGSGIATLISQSFMLAIFSSPMRSSMPYLARYRLFSSVWRLDWPKLKALWRLGVPIAATITFEITIFAGAVFLMGVIGAVVLEAHALVFQIASMAFMVPLGVSQAATVRVGHADARNAWCVACRLDRAGDLPRLHGLHRLDDAAVSKSPDVAVHRYLAPKNAGEILERAQSFLIVAALFQIFDGSQVVAAGMLRGVQDARLPMLIALFGYWASAARRRRAGLPDAARRRRPLDRARLRPRLRGDTPHPALALERAGGIFTGGPMTSGLFFWFARGTSVFPANIRGGDRSPPQDAGSAMLDECGSKTWLLFRPLWKSAVETLLREERIARNLGTARSASERRANRMTTVNDGPSKKSSGQEENFQVRRSWKSKLH